MSGVDEFEDLETWKKPEDKPFDNWMVVGLLGLKLGHMTGMH